MDEINNIILLIGSGLLFRTALIYTGQLWAKSHAQTVSFLVLPMITFVITNTIANYFKCQSFMFNIYCGSHTL